MANPTQPVAEHIIIGRLESLPGWTLKDGAIELAVRTDTYLAGLELLNRVAHLAESLNHHPDMMLGWCRLTVRLWTHTAGGVTEKDLDMAGRINETIRETIQPLPTRPGV